MEVFLKPFVKFWCSLRLTVVCLLAALVLVFVGTLAQVDQGLYDAQKKYFRSYLLIPEAVGGAGWAQIRMGDTDWGLKPWETDQGNWTEIEGTQFSMLQFEAVNGAERATISVSKLAKGAGGLKENINRWRGQLGLERVETLSGTESITVDGNYGTYVELTGTQNGRPAKTIGVIHELRYRQPYETWFYKLTGDAAVVDAV